MTDSVIDWNWYWDVPDGGGKVDKSPIWNPDHGFGGNGLPANETVQSGPSSLFSPPPGAPLGPPRGTGGGCITDGPFKETKLFS